MSSIEYKTTPSFIAEYQTSHDWTLEYGTSNFNQVVREKIERNKLAELNKWFGIFSCTKIIEDLKRQDKEYLDITVGLELAGVFSDPKESCRRRYHVVFYVDKASPLPDQKNIRVDDNCLLIPDQVHSSVLKVINEWSEARGFQLQQIDWTRLNGSFNLEILVLTEPSRPSQSSNGDGLKPESGSVREYFFRIKFVKSND